MRELVAMRATALDVEQEVDLAVVHSAMKRASIAAQRLRAAMPRLWARFDQITSQEAAAK